MATEQRAFAAVHKDTKSIDLTTVARTKLGARNLAGEPWIDGWLEAYRFGWRIRPVIIRLEEQDNG